MLDYNNNEEREYVLEDCIKELQSVNSKLSKLSLKKEEITEQLVSALGHQHEGQKTYEYSTWKIEIKTPCIYSLNKKLYESIGSSLPKKFNPIKKSTAYSIDKRLCDQHMLEAPEDIRDILVELIEKKPGKASVAIKERI